jgi:hypothetical protein
MRNKKIPRTRTKSKPKTKTREIEENKRKVIFFISDLNIIIHKNNDIYILH